jgi:hypothetical protein
MNVQMPSLQPEGAEIFPGPQKYGSFWLRVQPAVGAYAENCPKLPPRDSAPNNSLFDAVFDTVVASNTLTPCVPSKKAALCSPQISYSTNLKKVP